MTSILVDSNIFIDILWGGTDRQWSRTMLVWLGSERSLVVNQVIWSEMGAGFENLQQFGDALHGLALELRSIPFEAAFLAGQAHRLYRRKGGQRERTLPDFLVGAHAQVDGLRLLTRDPSRYRTYFPSVSVVGPDTHPLPATPR